MSICLSKKTCRTLSNLWLDRSSLGKSRHKGICFFAVREFMEWLHRHDIWLMTHDDALELGDTESEIKEIRKIKRGG